ANDPRREGDLVFAIGKRQGYGHCEPVVNKTLLQTALVVRMLTQTKFASGGKRRPACAVILRIKPAFPITTDRRFAKSDFALKLRHDPHGKDGWRRDEAVFRRGEPVNQDAKRHKRDETTAH